MYEYPLPNAHLQTFIRAMTTDAGASAPPKAQMEPGETARKSRPLVVGPETPEAPYPIFLEGPVENGFGRGGKDLGCPTANLPPSVLAQAEEKNGLSDTGVYYGWARVVTAPPGADETEWAKSNDQTWPMVMSLGYNPFYGNSVKTAEIHIMHKYPRDFYGATVRSVVLGYIRPEFNYTSVEALIEDIETDKRAAVVSLNRPAYKEYQTRI